MVSYDARTSTFYWLYVVIHVVIAIEITERTNVGFMWFGSVLTSKEMTAQTFTYYKKKGYC